MAGKINKTSYSIPGGNVKQLQYNDAGLFGGCAQLFWDSTNNRLGIGTTTPSSELEISEGRLTISHSTTSPAIFFKDLEDNDIFQIYHHRAGDRLSISSNDNADIFSITKAGNIGIGTSTPATSALLDLTSTTSALLLTRMTTTQRNALTAVNGMMVYDSTLNKFQSRENGAWISLIAGDITADNPQTASWLSDTSVTGEQLDTLIDNSIANTLHRHSKLVASSGTPDPALSVNAFGWVGIGLTAPQAKLHIEGSSEASLRIGSADISPFIQLYDSADNDYFKIFMNRVSDYCALISNTTNDIMVWKKAGNIGIGTSTPATSALLDLTSTTSALLLTRMTTTQRNALTAVNGMMVYDSTLNKFQSRENGAWVGDTSSDDNNAAVYTVYKSGSTYYAKASTISGLSDYSGNAFHTVLQSALDATDDAGGIIDFAPGTYSVTGKITGRSDVILRGCGNNWGSKGTIFSLDAPNTMFEFGVTECFEFKNILFDGNDRNQVTLYFHGTGDGTPCQNFHITKCGFKDCRCAISAIYTYDCYISDTGFTSCGYFASSYYACYASTGCNAWHFRDCRWETLKGHAFYSGASGNHAFHFIGCKFHGYTSYQYHAIAGYMSFGSIVGCFFYNLGASYRAIYSQGDGLCITGNVFENCKGYAIQIVAGANKNSITGNTFYTITNITAHIGNAGTNTTIVGNTVYEANNDLVVHTDTSIRGLNCAAFSNLKVRDDNVQAMNNGTHWTPSPGLYNISCWGPELQLYVNGAWRTSDVGIDGMVYCDGTNQRIYNNAGSSQNVYWQRF